MFPLDKSALDLNENKAKVVRALASASIMSLHKFLIFVK